MVKTRLTQFSVVTWAGEQSTWPANKDSYLSLNTWSGCYHWFWFDKINVVWMVLYLNLFFLFFFLFNFIIYLNLSMMTKINIEEFCRFLSKKTLTVAHSHYTPANGCHLAWPNSDQNHQGRVRYPLLMYTHIPWLKQVCKIIARALCRWKRFMNQVLSVSTALSYEEQHQPSTCINHNKFDLFTHSQHDCIPLCSARI